MYLIHLIYTLVTINLLDLIDLLDLVYKSDWLDMIYTLNTVWR